MNHSHQSHHSRTGLTSHLFYACEICFLSLRLFLLCSESDNEEYDESDGGKSGSDFTFDSCFLHFDVEIDSYRIISIRVGISLIFSRSSIFSIFCSSIRFILSQVSISFICSCASWSRCNIFIFSKSNSLIYFLNANFSFIFLISSWVAAVPMLLGLGL